jgi:hypothetical protein
MITLKINGKTHSVDAPSDMPTPPLAHEEFVDALEAQVKTGVSCR